MYRFFLKKTLVHVIQANELNRDIYEVEPN